MDIKSRECLKKYLIICMCNLQKVFFKYAIIQNNKKIKTGKNLYLIWFKVNELSYKEYKLAERKLNI